MSCLSSGLPFHPWKMMEVRKLTPTGNSQKSVDLKTILRNNRREGRRKQSLDGWLLFLRSLVFTDCSIVCQQVATISQSDACNLHIAWLDSKYSEKSVNLAAVMNQGVYCVTEFCPISKARNLFTGLGLRHVVVMGGPSGGDVVGVLTRASFLDDFLRERTGAWNDWICYYVLTSATREAQVKNLANVERTSF